MVWKRRCEGLDLQFTSNKNAGSGGGMTNFIVAISHGHGVVLCESLKAHLVNLSTHVTHLLDFF